MTVWSDRFCRTMRRWSYLESNVALFMRRTKCINYLNLFLPETAGWSCANCLFLTSKWRRNTLMPNVCHVWGDISSSTSNLTLHGRSNVELNCIKFGATFDPGLTYVDDTPDLTKPSAIDLILNKLNSYYPDIQCTHMKNSERKTTFILWISN